ncbi:hypothetical protein GF362_04850 [Candidatus Dojkabacteria bacterium]|nr:hypothetical protein [Candidatus Dojkabacteria bacterium]
MYSKLADMTLKQFGIHESIQKIDYKLSLQSLTEPAEDLWDDIENFFGDDIDDSEIAEIEEMETGYFEKNLYPKLINLVTIIYRFFITLFSLAGLIVIVYLSYITSGITDLDNLKRKYSKLEKRIQTLEKKRFNN